jgi:hypothetical protein
MKPSLFYRFLLGECIPFPEMTVTEFNQLSDGIRKLLETVEQYHAMKVNGDAVLEAAHKLMKEE